MEEDCSNEELPTFWMDMCSHIPTNSSDYVNLQLNPERYTGYNGSHVWEAIYKENCLIRTGGHDDNMCYEERVLYRLLSGMHAATNTHIARFYHAPSKRKNRTEWEPDVAYFTRQFRNAPERLRNMHFAFVVLLRAIRRASPYLSSYSYTSGDESEDRRTTSLVHRLLDTHILESCSSVFEAFDETLLFRESASQISPWWSLKKQFKVCCPRRDTPSSSPFRTHPTHTSTHYPPTAHHHHHIHHHIRAHLCTLDASLRPVHL